MVRLRHVCSRAQGVSVCVHQLSIALALVLVLLCSEYSYRLRGKSLIKCIWSLPCSFLSQRYYLPAQYRVEACSATDTAIGGYEGNRNHNPFAQCHGLWSVSPGGCPACKSTFSSCLLFCGVVAFFWFSCLGKSSSCLLIAEQQKQGILLQSFACLLAASGLMLKQRVELSSATESSVCVFECWTESQLPVEYVALQLSSLAASALDGCSSAALRCGVISGGRAIKVVLPVLLGKPVGLFHGLFSNVGSSCCNSMWLLSIDCSWSAFLCSTAVPEVIVYVCVPWFFSALVVFGVEINRGVLNKFFFFLRDVPVLRKCDVLCECLIPPYTAVKWKEHFKWKTDPARSWVPPFSALQPVISTNSN